MHTRKRILSILNFVIFLVYFTMLGIATPFLSSVPTGEGGFDTILSENDMYKMIDNFYDPEDFSDFREKPENINMLASFYNELQMSDKFEVVTSFNQAIYVDDFKGDNRFYFNSDEFVASSNNSAINIKALQVNKEAYDFYRIVVEEGNAIPWESVSYQGTSIPILAGSDYKELYQQGDIIVGNYYSKIVNFEIIGFLRENFSIEYRNISKLNLDSYIIIPYPKKLWNVKNDFMFEGILYFAMVNCYILPHVDEISLLKEVKEIADETGFTDFALVGIENFQLQNIQLLLLAQDYRGVIILALLGLFVVVSAIGTGIFSRILKYSGSRNIKRRYKAFFLFYVIVPNGIAAILGILFSALFLKKVFMVCILVEVMSLMLTYIGIYFINKKGVNRTRRIKVG